MSTQQWLTTAAFRKQLQKWWNIPALLIVFLLVLQTIMGHYNGMVSSIWLWAGLVLFPAWVLMLLSAWWNKFPARLITKSTARGFIGLAVVFLVLLLLTILLSQLAIDRSDWSLQQYFYQSFWWLLPLQLVLVAGIVVLLYRKETKKIPDAAVISEMAKDKAAGAAEKGNLFQEQIFALVAEGNLEEALKLLREQFEQDAGIRNQVIMLQSQLLTLQKDQNMNIIEPAEAQRRLNRLAMGILNLTEF